VEKLAGLAIDNVQSVALLVGRLFSAISKDILTDE
jgi:hypothetical protein